MKIYILYVDGVETPYNKKSQYIKASNHNAAEKKAQVKFPGRNVQVAYTEI